MTQPPPAGATRARTSAFDPKDVSTGELISGRRDVRSAAPALPTDTLAGVKVDMATVQQGISR